jgi:hypothetical protein
MLGLRDMMIMLGSLALSLAVLIPLVGTLVRFRAHYNPKGLQLDSEGDVQPHTGPVVSSFFGMLKRVHRIEVGTDHKTAALESDCPTFLGLARTIQGIEYAPHNSTIMQHLTCVV